MANTGPSADLKKISSAPILACMATRVIGAASLTRDLGRWRNEEPGAAADSAKRSARPAYVALAESIRLLIHDGRAPLGVALPSERDLATSLAVSRTTVTSAYTLLREHGYLISRQGSRSTVALPPTVVHDGAKPARSILAMMAQPELPTIDMTYAAMAAPPQMTEAYSFALQGLPTYLGTHGMDPVGVLMLREALARRYTERGLPTDPEQILITLGAQHGLRLLLNVLTTAGRTGADRAPHLSERHRGHSRCRRAPGAGPHAPRRLGSGRNPQRRKANRRQRRLPDPRLQQPHRPPARHRGPGRAGRHRPRDPHDGHRRRIHGRPEPLRSRIPAPVAAFARNSEIVTIGSASKSFWGGLRVGWVRANQSLITKLLGTRSTVDLGTPVMDQLATVHLLRHADEILTARRAQLRSRRAALLETLAEELPDWYVNPGAGGMSLWAQLPAPVSTALAATAPNHGVLLAAGPRFGVQGAFERFIRLPFTHEEPDIRIAVKSIATAYQGLTPHAADPLAPLIAY